MVSIIKFSDHKVLRLRVGSFVDKLKIGDNWDSLNLGILMRITFDTNPANNTSIIPLNIHIGLCSGPGTGIDSYPLVLTNFVGLRISGSSQIYFNSGGYTLIKASSVGNTTIYASKMQGATETSSALAASTIAFSAGSDTYLSIHGIQVNRSAATVKGLGCYNTAGSYETSFIKTYIGNSSSRAKLRQNMRGDITENMIATDAASLAMPTGPLDHICVYNGSMARNLDIHAIHVHKIS